MSAVKLKRDGDIATLSLENPSKRNALSRRMLDDLHLHADTLASDTALRLVILRGGDEAAFCSGGDLDGFEADDPAALAENVRAMDAALDRALAAVEALPVPVIALIRGGCVGAGLALALAADMRVVVEKARFGIPAIQLGMTYPTRSLARLVALCGSGGAARILYCGDVFDEDAARGLGLVDLFVDTVQEGDGLPDLVTRIAEGPRPALTGYKAMLKGLAQDGGAGDAVERAHADLASHELFVPQLAATLKHRKGG